MLESTYMQLELPSSTPTSITSVVVSLRCEGLVVEEVEVVAGVVMVDEEVEAKEVEASPNPRVKRLRTGLNLTMWTTRSGRSGVTLTRRIGRQPESASRIHRPQLYLKPKPF